MSTGSDPGQPGFSDAALGVTEPQATPAPAPQPSPEPQPAPESAADLPVVEPPAEADERVSVRDFLSSKGYDTSTFADDDALGEHLLSQLEAARQVPQLQQAARYAEWVQPYAEDVEALIRQRQQGGAEPATQPPPAGAQPAAEPAAEPYWPKPPEWDPTWDQYVTQDDQGNYVTSPNSPSPGLHHKFMARREWDRRQAARLLEDPAAAVLPGLQPHFDKHQESTLEKVKELLAADRQQQHDNAFVIDNQAWLYQQDANGRPLVDRQSGQPVFSPQGMLFQHYAQQLQGAGTDPSLIPQLAMQMTIGPNGQAQTAQPAGEPPQPTLQLPGLPATGTTLPAQPPGEQAKDDFIAGGTYTPGRSGSIAAAAQPHAPALGPDEDPLVMLERDFKEAGVQSTD